MSGDRDAFELRQRTQALLQAGDWRGAEQQLLQAVDRNPDWAEAWNQLGRFLRSAGRLGDALQAHGHAAALDPADVVSRVQIGHLFRQMSFPDDAISWYQQAVDLRPNDLILQLNHALVLPVVAESTEQMQRLRQRGLEQLERLPQMGVRFELGQDSFLPHTYHLIYQGYDNRNLLETYGRLLRSVVPRPAEPVRRAPPEGLIRRVGFLSGYFYQHTNSRAFEGWIRHLDRSRFRLVLIHLHDSKRDAIRSRLDGVADQVVNLAGDLRVAQKQLLDLRLDLLFFTDIGMHPMITLLSCCRYAPVQVTGWGVPQTSGMPCLDAYISGDLVEPEAAQLQYSEKLIQVPGLPCCYLSDHLQYQAKSREFFFLPVNSQLIGCLQSLWKLSPEFDSYLECIAQRVPEAWFIFIAADVSSYNQIFLERLQTSAPTVRQMMIMLQRMEREDFIALVEQLDLLLDPPNFSSGILMFDTLHTGTPIVATEGPFLRSRFVAGAYRQMGLEQPPIARDKDHYIEIAVQLLNNPDLRQILRGQIRERAKAHLYDRLEGLRAFEEFAIHAIDHPVTM